GLTIRRTARDSDEKEVIRCLKRYIAREVYRSLRGRSTGACERISLRSPRLDIYRNVRVNFTSKPNPT
ncbi:MAG TPA: hypothetical protein VEY33_12350, partial [Gemmatimonadota bacterium]|nr:hypothetical protein [Gemmatimonadota bacterium]